MKLWSFNLVQTFLCGFHAIVKWIYFEENYRAEKPARGTVSKRDVVAFPKRKNSVCKQRIILLAPKKRPKTKKITTCSVVGCIFWKEAFCICYCICIEEMCLNFQVWSDNVQSIHGELFGKRVSHLYFFSLLRERLQATTYWKLFRENGLISNYLLHAIQRMPW